MRAFEEERGKAVADLADTGAVAAAAVAVVVAADYVVTVVACAVYVCVCVLDCMGLMKGAANETSPAVPWASPLSLCGLYVVCTARLTATLLWRPGQEKNTKTLSGLGKCTLRTTHRGPFSL